jgi:hypothetical protein
MLTELMLRIGGLIAAALYGNIGIKVVYNNVLMEIFRKSPYTFYFKVTDF